jgi:GntR family transcriptional repressor for pyruvate dehydrogenase complex
VEEIERENQNPHGTEKADRAFHLAIARATRNAAITEAVERLWDLRAVRPKARCCTKRPAAPTSSRGGRTHAVLEALRAHDPPPRAAMRPSCRRARQPAVCTEEKAIEPAAPRAPSANAMPAPPCETII